MVGAPSPELTSSSEYELEEQLGSGATSDVWRARPLDRNEAVVLKIARDRSHARALAGEALVSALALSPRLPELVAVGTLERKGNSARLSDTGHPFVALRDTGGESLAMGRANAGLALSVARDVAEALGDLYAVGLAHGDVKPQNVTRQRDGGRANLIDLGLAGPAHRTDVSGATPRYLARGDRRLGNAMARDLLALGLLVAELATDEVAESQDPLATARSIELPPEVASLCAALLSPEPGARPSARWVFSRAAALLNEPGGRTGERDVRRVRAAYLRLRRWELGRARRAEEETAPWVREHLTLLDTIRAMCRAADTPPPDPLSVDPDHVLAPLTAPERRRWLVALVGSAATNWPIEAVDEVPEPDLAHALSTLAGRHRPEVWTLRDLEAALHIGGAVTASRDEELDPTSPEGAAALAIRLDRIPPDTAAVEIIEEHAARAPESLTIAAADALRLAGELGRARSLIASAPTSRRGLDVAADILRRCGDVARAAVLAEKAMRANADPEGRARACRARLHYEAGELDAAANLLGDRPAHAATAEVLALVQVAQGDITAALATARRGDALAKTAESRARLSATVAFIEQSTDADRARERFRAAAEHAVRAGAVLEEASYLTGEAATSVDAGALDAALAAADRAALLWEEVLDRPEMAARAWLAKAAAFAVVDAHHEAVQAAEQAILRATECGDARAEAYASWAIADVSDAGSSQGARAARRARALVGDDGEDYVHAAARLLRHAPGEVTEAEVASLDATCRHAASAPASSGARLAWWGARATATLSVGVDDTSEEAHRIVSELCALADVATPVEAAGRAMFAGTLLAAALGETDALARLEAARKLRAERLREGARDALREAVRSTSWIVGRAESRQLDPGHAVDLRQLVLALSERDSLRKLLDRVLDVLIMWTGAERGLLLMKGDDAKLVPHAARNIGKSDLETEQLLLSTSLAQRALDSGEPVVAIDAMEELSSSYDSVHALKLRSVLALPLVAHGDVLGVVYLDDRLRRGAFGDREVSWAQSVAPVAALAIADARTQVELRRSANRAERAQRKLEETLARKETALDVAERELARTVHGNATRLRHDSIVGESEPMQKLLAMTDRVAASDVPVLLLGESGSGKELIARALHRGSHRGGGAFVSENCGALPETLLESTLFGHTKGAFTGAHRPRVGLFEAADEGTLFLDEIGEMSLGMQTKLLRVLEDNLVRPVGSTRSRRVDVRIVAATHRDLDEMVRNGTFREDLYYRLNVISIRIPPLRERSSDVPLLVDHLLSKHAPGRHVMVTKAAMSLLKRHGWPGNVRQLENEVRRALLLADEEIDTTHLSIEDAAGADSHELGLHVRTRIDHLEVELVTEAMKRTEGNQTQAAKLLGISRYGLHKMMKRLGIKK